MLPELTDEQAQTLRDGGPTGHLVDDVLAVTLDCLHADDGTPVARGVVAYDSAELAGMLGKSTSDLAPDARRPVVHADDLVAV